MDHQEVRCLSIRTQVVGLTRTILKEQGEDFVFGLHHLSHEASDTKSLVGSFYSFAPRAIRQKACNHLYLS